MEIKKKSIYRIRDTERKSKANLREILSYSNIVLDVALKAAALSITIGAFVVHNYLSGMGYLYLFPSMLGSQGGLLSIVFGFGLFSFLMSLMLAAGPVYLWHLRNGAIKNEEFRRLYTIHRLALLQIATQVSLMVSLSIESKYSLAISIGAIYLCSFVWNFSTYDSRKYFSVSRFKNNKRQYFSTLGENTLSITLGMVLPVAPWIFLSQTIPSISKSIPVPEGYFDNIQYVVFMIWILFYSYASSFIVLAGSANRLEVIKRVGWIVTFTMTIFVVLIPQMFLDAGMYIISIREMPSEARWYSVKKDVFEAVMPVSNMRTTKVMGNHFYVKAYSPFGYGDKRVLCDEGIKKPTAALCILLSETEARPATLIESAPAEVIPKTDERKGN